jgi:hypothetical protein
LTGRLSAAKLREKERSFYLIEVIVSSVAAPSGTFRTASALRRLYFVRAAFAVVWAVVTIVVAKETGPLTTALFVVYPLFDVGAAVYDFRSSRTAVLYVNIVVSLVTAVGLGIAGLSGIPAMLRVWGAWAVVAGLVQLVVGVRRRSMGGQWPMIISGGISVLAGVSFFLSASAESPVLNQAAGYAIPGAVFFLISALRLGRAARPTTPTSGSSAAEATTLTSGSSAAEATTLTSGSSAAEATTLTSGSSAAEATTPAPESSAARATTPTPASGATQATTPAQKP